MSASAARFVAGGHNWAPQRDELIAAGDEDGLQWLDKLLPRIQDEPVRTVQLDRDGVSEEVEIRVLCAADVLDALRDRRHALEQLDQMQPFLGMCPDTTEEICVRWKGLSAFVPKFAHRADDGEFLVRLADGDVGDEQQHVPGTPGLMVPVRQWITAFHEATRALLPHVRDSLVLHALLRDIERVLGGEGVSLTENIRDVDLQVRQLEGHEQSAEALAEAYRQSAQREQRLVLEREHADSTAGRAILKRLLRDGEVKTEDLKRAAIAAVEARSSAGDRDGEAHGRAVEATLRVLRDRCDRHAGCAPCPEHLAMVVTPRRGTYRLTEAGRSVAEAQKRGDS